MITLTYLDERRLWLNGLTVRGVFRYRTLVTLLTDAGGFWFPLSDYLQATMQPCVAELRPLSKAHASATLGAQLLPIDGWADGLDLFAWN